MSFVTTAEVTSDSNPPASHLDRGFLSESSFLSLAAASDPNSSFLSLFPTLIDTELALLSSYSANQTRRLKYSVFWLSLVLCTSYFIYSVLINPSIYAFLHFMNQIALCVSFTTLLLFHTSGVYKRTIVNGRRFLSDANAGLISSNVRLIRVPTSRWERILELVWRAPRPGMGVQLVLSPRTFEIELIDAWEIYREEFWADVELNGYDIARKKKI